MQQDKKHISLIHSILPVQKVCYYPLEGYLGFVSVKYEKRVLHVHVLNCCIGQLDLLLDFHTFSAFAVILVIPKCIVNVHVLPCRERHY